MRRSENHDGISRDDAMFYHVARHHGDEDAHTGASLGTDAACRACLLRTGAGVVAGDSFFEMVFAVEAGLAAVEAFYLAAPSQ